MLLPLLLPLAALAQDAPVRTLTVDGSPTERQAPPSLRGGSGKTAWSVELVHVPGGTFFFGPLPGEGDPRQPAGREVAVPSFWIADVETPWGLFRRFCDPAEKAAWPSPDWKCPVAGDESLQREDLPVVNVTWWDAVYFCNWLTMKELGADARVYEIGGDGSVTVHTDRTGYRLPTEEEWEWAARAGNAQNPYSGYSLPSWGCDYANTPTTTCMKGTADVFERTAPARPPASGKGAFKPNTWGLFQMSGNVQEWTNGVAPGTTDELRVLKGGSWDLGRVVVNATSPTDRREVDAGWVIYRLADLPTRARLDGGFRLVRSGG